jgi:hypothetical protein
VIVCTWLDPPKGQAMAMATAPSWSLARLAHLPGGVCLCHCLSRLGSLQRDGIVCIIHNIRSRGSSSTSVLAFAFAIATHHTHKSNYSPAAPGILRVAQVPPSLHPLHLDLGAPAAVYGSAMPQWSLCQAILAQWSG